MSITVKHFMSNSFNIGDALIADSVSRLLQKSFGDCKLVEVCCQGNELWQNFNGINQDTLNFGPTADLVLIGGHPLLGRRDLLKYDRNINFSTPAFMLGVGSRIALGEISAEYWDYIEPLLEKVDAISVRDTTAEKIARKYNKNVFLTGCPALYRYDSPLSYHETGHVAVSFDGRGISDKLYLDLVKELRKRGLKSFFLVHDFRELDRAKKIAEQSGAYFIASPDYDFYSNYIETAKLLIGFRLHGFIQGLSLGTPSVLVYNDHRGLEYASLIDPQNLISLPLNPRVNQPKSRRLSLTNRLAKRRDEIALLGSLLSLVDQVCAKEISLHSIQEAINTKRTEMTQFLDIMKTSVEKHTGQHI